MSSAPNPRFLTRSLPTVCSALGSFLLATAGAAQTVDSFDPAPNNPNNYAFGPALAVEYSGKIFVGGPFTQLCGQTRQYLGLLHEDGSLDSTFNPGPNSYLRAIVIEPGGKMLVSGNFTNIAGQGRKYLARFHRDRTLDFGFNPAGDQVHCMAVTADGKIVASGSNFLRRYRDDGSMDPSFIASITGAPSSGATASVLLIQPDNRILVGGEFIQISGESRTNLARLNADGTVDTNFNASLAGLFGYAVLQPDGKIIVAGGFKSVGGGEATNVARLHPDGTLDTTFHASASSPVTALSLQADGKILVGGWFTNLSGYACTRIGRLHPDGSFDETFVSSISSPPSVIALQPNGKVLVGGNVFTLNGVTRTRLGRLINTDAPIDVLSATASEITWFRGGTAPEIATPTIDSSSNGVDWVSLGTPEQREGAWRVSWPGSTDGNCIRVRGLVPAASSSWIIEQFYGAAKVQTSPLSRTNAVATDATFTTVAIGSPPFNFQWFKGTTPLVDGGNVSGTQTPTLSVSNVLGLDAGDYFVVVSNSFGAMTSTAAHLTVIDPFILASPVTQGSGIGETALFSVEATGTAPLQFQWRKDRVLIAGANSNLLTITNVQVEDFGLYDVIVSNTFGVLTSAVAGLSFPSTPDSLNAPFGTASSLVSALAVQRDGKILAGGYTGRFLRYNADGTTDGLFNPKLSGDIFAVAVQPDGKILVGGWFSPFVVRLHPNGAIDPAFTPPISAGVNEGVYSIAVRPDGKILLAGQFRFNGSEIRTNIVQLLPDGSLDSSFRCHANDIVYALALQPDGKIIAGGAFTNIAGVPRERLARLNPDGTVDPNFNPGNSNLPLCFALQPDGKILVGGTFATMGGQPRKNIGRLNPDGTLDSSFDPGADSVVRSMALQADGRIIVGGSFSQLAGHQSPSIGRLYSDGTFDPCLVPNVTKAVGSPVVYAVCIAPDGKPLFAGSFGSVGGQPRTNLARLNATAPPINSLSFDGSVIVWNRGGTAPEISHASFEVFTNGTSIAVEQAVRTNGGWQFTGSNLPVNASIRARALVLGGRYNSSSSIDEITIGPLAITREPENVTTPFGTSPYFSVEAVGTMPLAFQWYKEGAAVTNSAMISGVTSGTLMFSNVVTAAAGDYWVIVSDATGSVTSRVATLTIENPGIITQPRDVATNAGTSISLSVKAGGSAPMSYQWYQSGVRLMNVSGSISGAQGATLTIASVLRANAGDYKVVITNASGAITSRVASVTVNEPFIANHPSPRSAMLGGTATFTATIYGTQPLACRWRRDGVEVATTTGGSLTLTNLQAEHVGMYNFVVSNAFGVATSSSALLTVNLAGLDSFQSSADARVNCLLPQPDGKILVGGDFTTLNGQTRSRLGRLYPGGELDLNFNPGANGPVNAFAIKGNGNILVAGAFTTLAGQPAGGLGELTREGALVSSWTVNGSIETIAMQADGRIVVGGQFTNVAGYSRTNIARFNVDGTLDPMFVPQPNGTVRALAQQEDGALLVVGSFNSIAGQSRNLIARLHSDGTLDLRFTPGPISGTTMHTVAIQRDGKVLLGGNFTEIQGVSRRYIARLNPDGSVDPLFNPGANNRVLALVVQSDGAILVGGDFVTLAGVERQYLGRLLEDGAPDGTFNPAPNLPSRCLVLQQDGKVLVGGSFQSLAGATANYIGRLGVLDPVIDELILNGTEIVWLRGGSSPEVWRTTFDASTDGINWISLGSGIRIDEGWKLTRASVPSGSAIRARGFFVLANLYGSSGFFETTLPAIRPAIMMDGRFGFGSNNFGFNISSPTGQVIAIDTSSDLIEWSELLRVTNGTGIVDVFDPNSTNHLQQFYRLRTP